MRDNTEEKPVRETEEYEFYRNHICEGIEDMFRSPDRGGITMGDMRVLMAVSKETGESEYIAFDRDGRLRAIMDDLYDADIKVRALKMQLQDGLDIRNIARSGELPKVV